MSTLLAAQLPKGETMNTDDYAREARIRRVARIDPSDLTDLALGQYANQWTGTTRGDAALAEIARREERNRYDLTDEETPEEFETRQAAYDAEHAERVTTVTVRETIRHGDYRHDGSATAPTLARAVAVLLNNSPYGNHTDEPITSITADLTATGHAAYGWADYRVI